MKIAKYMLPLVLGLIVLATPTAIWANTITFQASGTFVGGGILGGTVTIDTTLGIVTAADLTTTVAGFPGPFTSLSSQFQGATVYDFVVVDALLTNFDIQINSPSLIGYGGGGGCA